jgi:ATP-dependent DNA helicase RecG
MTLHESDTLEFKKSLSLIEHALKSVCGFLNHHGGVISFGRTNTGLIVGVDPADHSLRKLSQQISSRIKPEITPDIRVIEEQGKHLIVVTVPEGTNKPYFLDGIAYIRAGTETRVIPPDELKRMILTISQPPWDREICSGASIDDIDTTAIYDFLAKARDGRRLEAEAGAPVHVILKKLHLLNNGSPTNAAILIFGKDPQQFIHQAAIRCGHFSGTDVTNPTISMKIIDGPLMRQIDDTISFILSETRKSAWIVPGKSRREEHWDYPPEAVRETVINALCHRDYRSVAHAQVRIFAGQLQVWNPGKLPNVLTVESLKTDHLSLPRNTIIADLLFLAGFIEQWGSGTIHMVKSCREHTLPDPEFREQDDSFSVTFTRSSINRLMEEPDLINDRQKRALGYLRQHPMITSAEYAKQFDCTPKTAQRDLSEMEALHIVMKKGKGRSTVYQLNDSFRTFPDISTNDPKI